MQWFMCLRRNAWPVHMLLASLIFSFHFPKASAQPHQDETDLLLAVVVNGRPINEVGDFKERGGKLYATPTELDSLGLRMTSSALLAEPDKDMPLDGLDGVSYRVDQVSQTIYFTVKTDALKATVVDARGENNARSLALETGLGATVNYNVVGTTSQNGKPLTQALLGTTMFGPYGVMTSSFVGTSGAQASTPPFLRLDSTYSYSDVDTMRRYRIGDVITGGLSWTRPIRLGGLQVTTDFSIRPDLVTFPVPTLAGMVAVPSSIDVLVNGVQLLSRDVTPGPFEVRQLPIVTGAGDVSLVVHNAVGQDTTQTLPIYATNLLLAKGLTAFSAELGVIRLNYGVLSNDYHAPAGSFSIRHGVLDWLTLEAHGEGNGPGDTYGGLKATDGGMVGGGAAVTVGRLGVISVAGAGSRFATHSGTLVSVSYERASSVVSLAASMQAASPTYGDIAASSGQPVPGLQARASIGFSLGNFGSFGIAYVGLRGQGTTLAQQAAAADQRYANTTYQFNSLSLLPPTNITLVSASYSRQILDQRAFLYSTAFHDFSNSSSSGLLVGITFPIGQRSSAGANYDGGGGGSSSTFQAMQPAIDVGDFGWQAQESTGISSRQLAVGEYKSPWGLIDAGIDRIAGRTTLRTTVQGALAYAGGGLFASNSINDSFAVVDTDKSEGIQVLQENRPVGRTGSSGLLLVPNLRSFDANRLGIDPTNVPVDTEIGEITRLVRPQDHAGVVVHFPVHSSFGAVVKLVDEAGTAIPVGSTAKLTIPAKAAEFIVGYDGDTFVTGLLPHNTLTVKLPNGHDCTAEFDYKPVPGTLPEIGQVKCLGHPS